MSLSGLGQMGRQGEPWPEQVVTKFLSPLPLLTSLLTRTLLSVTRELSLHTALPAGALAAHPGILLTPFYLLPGVPEHPSRG